MKTRRGELRSPAVPQKPLFINILFITGEHSSPLRPRWSEARKQQFTSQERKKYHGQTPIKNTKSYL